VRDDPQFNYVRTSTIIVVPKAPVGNKSAGLGTETTLKFIQAKAYILQDEHGTCFFHHSNKRKWIE
jgi:hypothetical protein